LKGRDSPTPIFKTISYITTYVFLFEVTYILRNQKFQCHILDCGVDAGVSRWKSGLMRWTAERRCEPVTAIMVTSCSSSVACASLQCEVAPHFGLPFSISFWADEFTHVGPFSWWLVTAHSKLWKKKFLLSTTNASCNAEIAIWYGRMFPH